MFTHRYRYWLALGLSVYTYLNTEFCEVYDHFNIRIAWYGAFLTILSITFFILESNRWLDYFLRRWVKPEENYIRYAGIFFLSGSSIASLGAALVVMLVGMVWHAFPLEDQFTPLKLNLMYAWLVTLLFHLLHTILYYFKEYRSTRLEAEELKRMQAQAELQLIRTQLNPHFLFNNLNVLSSLVIQNNQEANRFIEAFSQVYRYILQHHQTELVPLKTELEFIHPYLFLLKKRFGEGLDVSMDIPAHYNDYLIIPAALQLLIENAIKHNVVSRQKPLLIRLHANGNETMRVSNNLQRKQQAEVSSELGLKNISRRYALVSNRPVDIHENQQVFSVTIPLIKTT